MFYKNKKKIIGGILVIMVLILTGLVTNKYFNFDKYNNKIEVSSIKASNKSVYKDNLALSQQIKGYDVINYTIKYKLESSDKKQINNRTAVVEATLSDDEAKYATWNNVSLDNVTSEIINSGKTLKLTITGVTTNTLESINVKLNITGAPNGFSVNPSITVYEKNSAINETTINVKSVVKTNSISGYVINKTVDKYEKNVELKICKIESGLCTSSKTIFSNEDGSYSFSDLENGTYKISLVNASKYELINDLNSITINDEGKKTNVEVINKSNSDVTISKYIKKVAVTENGQTKTYDYGKIDKAVVAVKNMKNATAKIIYGFDIVNKGNKSRYIKVVKENIPDGLEYDENDKENSNWINKKGILYNKSLSNDAIKPGETRTLSISLKTKDSMTAQNYINNVSMTSENYYTVRYIVDGATVKEMMILDSDTAVNYKYSKEDYDFDGWYKSSDYKEKFDFDTPIDRDIDLYGKLEEKNKIKYKVTYKLDDGTVLETKEVAEGKTISKIDAPEKNGYDFVGFRLPNETEEFDYSTKIYEDTILIAMYKKKEYKVTFIDGEKETIQRVLYEEKIKKPNDPEKELYMFMYWSLEQNGEEFDFETKVTKDTTLYAVYKQSHYSISFVLNDKVLNDKVEVGTLLNEPEIELPIQYEKIEWYDENNEIVSFPLILTKNTTLYAKYITKKFDIKFINDGEEIQKIKVEYGKTITKPNDPIISGKEFKCWSLEENGKEFNFETKVTENLTLYAVFNKLNYTVKYMNLNEDGTYSQIGNTYKLDYDEDLPLIEDPQKVGYTFKGWSKTIGGEILNLPIKVRENITLYSIYTINEYTVTFHNEENVNKVKVNYNNVVIEPEKPISSNPLKDFKWWSLEENGEKYDFGTKVTQDIDLYAVYTGNMYTITFINEENVMTKKYEAGSFISEPEVTEKEGYTFKYWSIYQNGKDSEGNKSKYEFLLTPVESNLTLYAYYEANEMTVEFYNDSEISKTLNIDYNSVINQNDIPTVTKNGYTFTGWYEKDSDNNYLDTSFDFTKKIKKSTKLYAKYEKLPNGIIFNDENRLESVNVEYGQTTNAIESKGKEGYTFKYWSLDKINAFDFNTPITSTITLYAVYEINNYSVKFMNMNSDGTYVQIGDTYTISYNGEMPQIENPTLIGYEFKGWSLEENGEVIVLPTVVTKDVTYYAVYDHIKYDITFMSNNEKYGETQKLYYGDKISVPENPEAEEGKEFKHWSLEENGEAYDLTTSVTGNLTLYAVFNTKKITVTFMNQASDALYEEYDVKKVEYNNVISEFPSNPERTGYTFKYWSLEENGEEYIPSKLKKDITLYAVYEKEKVKVTFINNGSKYIDDITIDSGSVVTKPDSPSSTDTKIFKYWSLEENGDEFDFNTKITSNITLYAVYKENTVTITFGNCNIESITINYNSQIENMPNADTKEGYTFAYWSTSESGLDEENNELRFNVQSNITEDITLYAIYTHDSFTVTFENSSIENQTVYYGDKITKPSDPTGEYPFLYWSIYQTGLDTDGNKAEFDFNTIVKSNITLYAIYQVEKYTITFMVDGVQYGDIQYVNINEKITKPEDPTKTGNTFKYWSLEENGEAYDIENEITSSIVLYAVFKPDTYNVSFEFNGQLYEKQTVDYGNLAQEPTTKPSKEYYIFDGWYLNDVKYDFATPVTGNIILNAKFNKIETPVIEINPTNWTKDSVTVTITGPEGYTIKYKKGSEEYSTYSEPFEITENTSVTARLEKDGVISEEVTKNVGNIDKVSPVVEKLITSSVLQNSFLVNIKATDVTSGIKTVKIYLDDIEEPIKIYTYEENSENKTNTISESYKVENSENNNYSVVEGTTYRVKTIVEDFAGNTVTSDEVEVTTKSENYRAAQITSLSGEVLETPIQYSTLQDALDACPDSEKCTISLLDDLQESVEVYDTKDVTMDLNGKTLTSVRDNAVVNYGTLNIINNVLDSESNPIGGIVSDNTAIKTKGTLQLGENDDTVTTSPIISGELIGIDNTGTLKFYDGTIKGKNALKSTTIAKTPSSYNIVSITNNGIQSLTLGTIDDPEARINNIYFDKLSQAISTANNEDTIKLLKNVTVDSQMVTDENQTFTFDMNGYSIDGTTTYTDAEYDGLLVNKGNMTLIDTSDDVVKGDSVDKEKYDYDISDKFVSDGEYSFDYSDGVLTSNNKDTEYGQVQEDDGKTYYKNQSTGYIKLDLTEYTGKYVVSFDTVVDGTYKEYIYAEINESTKRVRYENLSKDCILNEHSKAQASMDGWGQVAYRYKYVPNENSVTKVLDGGKIYYLHIGFVRQDVTKKDLGAGYNGKDIEYYFNDYAKFSNFQIYQEYNEGTSVIGTKSSTETYITNLNNMEINGIHIYGNLDSKISSSVEYKYGTLEKINITDSSKLKIENGIVNSISASDQSNIVLLGGTLTNLTSTSSKISLIVEDGSLINTNISNSNANITLLGGNIGTFNYDSSYGKFNINGVQFDSKIGSGLNISGVSGNRLNANISNVISTSKIYVNRYVDLSITDSFVTSFGSSSYLSSSDEYNTYVINNVNDYKENKSRSSFCGDVQIIGSNLSSLTFFGNDNNLVSIDQTITDEIYINSSQSLNELKIINTYVNESGIKFSILPLKTTIKDTHITGSSGINIYGSLSDKFDFIVDNSEISVEGSPFYLSAYSSYNSYDNKNFKITNSVLSSEKSSGMYLSGYLGQLNIEKSDIIGGAEKNISGNDSYGIYTSGYLNIKSTNIKGFRNGLYLNCNDTKGAKLSILDNVTIDGLGVNNNYYGIYTSVSLDIKNSKISNFYYGIYNTLSYYTAGTPTLNINKINIDETIYGIWTRAICNIGESDKNVTKDFKIYGSSASIHGEKYSQSHINGAYTNNYTINFYDGILSQDSLSQVSIDNTEEGYVIKKEIDNKDRINLSLGKEEEEKPFGVSDKEYENLDTAIDAAMDVTSPKTSITPADAEEKLKKTNPLTKVNLSDFVTDGTYSFDYTDSKLVSNNKETETGTDDDNKFINQSTGYVKLDLTNLSGKYDIIVDHSIDTTTGANLGFVDITESKNIVKYEDISANARVIASASTRMLNSLYDEKYTFTINGGKVYYIHIGFIRRSSASSGISDTYTINDISYRKNIDKYLTTGDFVSDGKYSFDIIDGVLISNNKGSDYGIMTASPSEQINESTGYVKIDLSDKSGEYNLSFDSYLSTYATASIGYAVINESTKRVTSTNINNDENMIIMQESTENADCSSSCYFVPSKKTYETTLTGGKVYYLHFIFVRKSDSSYPSYEDTFRISNIKYRAKSSSNISKVKLLKDTFVTRTTQISSMMNVELDLNGHKLAIIDSNMFINNGTLTIKDSSTNGTGKILIYNESLVENNENSNLLLKDITIKFDFGKDTYNKSGVINNKGNVLVQNSKMKAISKDSNIFTAIYNSNSNSSSSTSSGYAKIIYSDIEKIETGGYYTASHFDIENSKIGTIYINSSGETPKEGYSYMVNISEQSEIENINIYKPSNILVENSKISKSINISSGELLMDNVTLKDDVSITNSSKLSILSGVINADNDTPIITNNSSGILILGKENNNKSVKIDKANKLLVNNGTASLYGVYGNTTSDTITNTNKLDIYSSELTSETSDVIKNNGTGAITIFSGNYIGKNGINNMSTGTITLGANDEIVNIDDPYVKGFESGIINKNGIFNFYDGKIVGMNGKAIVGSTSSRPDEYSNSPTVDGETETIILEKLPIVLNETKNKNYYSLQTAIDESSAGDTLLLLKDYAISNTITIDETKDVEILLDGHTISSKTSLLFKNQGNFILDGLVDDNNTKFVLNDGKLLENSGNATLYNIDLKSLSTDYIINNIENGELDIESLSIESPQLVENNGKIIKIVDSTINLSKINDVIINNKGELDLLNTTISTTTTLSKNGNNRYILNATEAALNIEKSTITLKNDYKYNNGVIYPIENLGEIKISKSSNISISGFLVEYIINRNNMIIDSSSVNEIRNNGLLKMINNSDSTVDNYGELNINESCIGSTITIYSGTANYNGSSSGSTKFIFSASTTGSEKPVLNIYSGTLESIKDNNNFSTVNLYDGTIKADSSFNDLNVYNGIIGRNSDVTVYISGTLYAENGTFKAAIGSSSKYAKDVKIMNGNSYLIYAENLTLGKKDGVANDYPTLYNVPRAKTFNYYDGTIQHTSTVLSFTTVDDIEDGYDIKIDSNKTVTLFKSSTIVFEYNDVIYYSFDELMKVIPDNTQTVIKTLGNNIVTGVISAKTNIIPENKNIVLKINNSISAFNKNGYFINNGILEIIGGDIHYENSYSGNAIINNGQMTMKNVNVYEGKIINNKNMLVENGELSGIIYGMEKSKTEIQSGTIGGISSEGFVYLGTNDNTISTSDPIINNKVLTMSSDKLYFYDGKINAYSLSIKEIITPKGYILSTSSPYVLTNGDNTDKIVYNGTSYGNLQSVINDCSEDEQSTITLYSDITLTSNIVIPEGKNIVLDYNDHTITKGSYTAINNGTVSEINLVDGQSKLFDDESSNGILGSIKNMINNTKYMNIVIYEEDNGSDLLSTYDLYKYENNKYKLVNLQEDDINNGVYKLTKNESNIKLSATGGKIYINNLDAGAYKLVSESGSETLFVISDDGKLTGKIKENKGVFNNILGSSSAELIFTIQTGQKVIKYGLLIVLLSMITGLLINIKNKKIAYKTKEN